MMTMWCPSLQSVTKPIYLAIADALETDIRSGKLVAGVRLPPQRELAYQLGVTLGTVTRAYKEAERRRLVRGETGRGTYIAPMNIETSPLLPVENASHELDLARNFAYPHLNPGLRDGLSRLAHVSNVDLLNGFVPSEGLERHRQAGAVLFKLFRLEANPDNILLSCGAQHGIHLALQAVFKSGDAIAFDCFTYPSLLTAIPDLGLKPVPVPLSVNPKGQFLAMDPDGLERAVRHEGVKGIFVMPNMQNPTTHTMSLDERQALVDVARRHDLKIIEDDPYTPFLDETLPSFGTLAPERTISLASVSKLVSPGSRIGFIHAPGELVPLLRNAIGSSTWMASPITAELVAGWILNGTVEETVRKKRQANVARYQVVDAVLGEQRIQSAPDKVFGWLRLDEDVRADMLEASLLRLNVRLLSSRYFQASHMKPAPFMRMTFGSIAQDGDFEQAVRMVSRQMKFVDKDHYMPVG